ncbi:MAG TPA: phosphoribosylformylglycinamidine synthase subunit PurS [Candidatus Limnocylindria bacterium]
MRYTATIHVRTKPEVRDPQGEATLGALRSLGLDVSDVRTGKEIVVTFEAADEGAASEAIRVMGNDLLANPVIDDYEYELAAETSAPLAAPEASA